jgi:uncharacterized protein (TIGR03435 family)
MIGGKGDKVEKKLTCISPDQDPRRRPRHCGNASFSPFSSKIYVQGEETSMERLTKTLSAFLDRRLIDETGFRETFNVDLEFARNDALSGPRRFITIAAKPTPPDDPEAATGFVPARG